MADQKSYKELQNELDEVLHELQSADLDIDKALALHKQGEKLLDKIEDYLNNARNKIEEIKK